MKNVQNVTFFCKISNELRFCFLYFHDAKVLYYSDISKYLLLKYTKKYIFIGFYYK